MWGDIIPSDLILETNQFKSKLPSNSGDDDFQYFKRKISCILFGLLPDVVGNLVGQEAVNKVKGDFLVSEAEITSADKSKCFLLDPCHLIFRSIV